MRRPNARFARRANPDSKMDPIFTKSPQLKQNPNSRSNTLSKSLKYQSKSNLLTISFVSLVFSVAFCLLFVFFRQMSGLENGRRFRVIIDGGSTGTRIHIFEFRNENGLPRFDFGSNGHWSMKVKPGLSSFESVPDRAGGSLVELLDFGKGRVPRELWGGTEVRLMATAGLRLLDLKVQEKILESCRRVLRGSGFKFRDDWATVITGSDEGLYAWVAANYALGTLGGDPHQTTGIIELGGASAQVTFFSSEAVPSELSRTLKYGNMTYNLYSNSLLHFGQNVAYDSMKELLVSSGANFTRGSLGNELLADPCTPKGYGRTADPLSPSLASLAKKYSSTFHAAGNFSECRAAALMLLQKDKEHCSYNHCTLGSTIMPKLRGRFLATENFFYTSQFFGLAPNTHLADLIMAGQRFCEEDWSNIRNEHPSFEEEGLLHYCFSSAYIVALLHDSLGIALDDERIGYTNQVGNTPLDWALGAFILQSIGGVNGGSQGWRSYITNDNSNLILLLGVAIMLMLVAWYALQQRKPSVKTIYDLEKGRYIVTRISR